MGFRLKPALSLLPLVAAAALLLATLSALDSTPDDNASLFADRQALVDAIKRSENKRIAALLDKGLDPHFRLSDGSLPLAWAAETQNLQALEMLLAAGAKTSDTTRVDANSFTPLVVACQYGNDHILSALLSAGADPGQLGPDGIPAFSICAGNASIQILSQMLDRILETGIDIDHSDQVGQTALMWAAANGRVANIQLLVEAGADPNRLTDSAFSPLFFAIKSGSLDAPLAMIELGADADYLMADGTSALKLAIYQKNYGFVAHQIEHMPDPTQAMQAYDRNGNQLLHAAVLANQADLAALLIDKGADLDQVTGPSEVTWRYEVNFTAKPYYVPPKTALLLAAEQGLPEMIGLLAEAGADTEFVAEDGTNLLLASVVSMNNQALQLALELTDDPNISNNQGQTALHLVLMYHSAGPQLSSALAMLESKGARPDIENKQGISAAAQAAMDEVKDRTFAAIFSAATATPL